MRVTMRRQSRFPALVLLTCVLALAACGGDEGEDDLLYGDFKGGHSFLPAGFSIYELP